MESPEIFIAFGAVMLVIALLGVAIDWFGKPLRHRRFVPKIYRFPEERQIRRSKVRETPWSSASFVLPFIDKLPRRVFRYPYAGTADRQQDSFPSDGALAKIEAQELPNIVTLEEKLRADNPGLISIGNQGTDPDDRSSGWSPGESVFNFTEHGAKPSARTIEMRFWRNVAITNGAAMFGANNLQRMQEGDPPKRWNPRTGQVESMLLPLATFEETGGETPVPSWPEPEPDPFVSKTP